MAKDRSFSTALHIMTAMAVHGDGVVCSEELAKGARTNPGVVRRILAKLVKRGLVESQKGKLGGSRLARTPERIFLRDVYLAVSDGPVFKSFEKDPYKPCPVSCQIGEILCDVFQDVEEAMVQKMGRLKLSQIVNRVRTG